MKGVRMKKPIVLVVVLLLFAQQAPIVKADEISELKQQMQKMQARLEQLEASQKAREQKVDEKISKAVESKQTMALPDSLKWAEKVKLSGDFRYRHETIEAENDGKPDRHRNRIRARLGLKAKVNDEWSLGFRLAGGSEDPVSTNQTLSGSFSSKGFWIDRAYFDYHPTAIENLHVVAGKMGNPFYKVGKNQLIWDGDLSPEGLAVKHKIKITQSDELFVNGGGFFVTESSSSDSDMSLWGAQGGLKHKFDKNTYALGGISYYDYGNIKGAEDLDVSKSNFFGNSSSGGVFVNDYDIVELFAEAGAKVSKTPVAAYGNYVKNCAADTSGDTGWLVGFKINKAKKPGSWEFSYDYRELQKDAVVGAFSDSDFIGGGTKGKGSRFGAKYQIAKNIQTGLSYFLNDRQDLDNNYRRLQVDMILKF